MKLRIPSRCSRPVFVASLAFGLFLASYTFSFAQTSTWNNAGSGTWDVGGNWLGGVPTGATTALLNNGGTAQLPGSVSGSYNTISIGSVGGGSGYLEVSGELFSGAATYLGYAAGGMGAATVTSGTWSNSSDLVVGYSGTGSLLVNGGLVTSFVGYIGLNGGSEGSATVSSGTWSNVAQLYVGESGTGSLLVNGGLVTTASGYIGLSGGSEGSATVSSGTWSNSSELSVGFSGTGSLLVNGGLVTNSIGYIGSDTGSEGSATVSSGTWSNSTDLVVGYYGTGSLLVNGGLVTDSSGIIGYLPGSEGSATVSSGTWSNSVFLYVGYYGTGSLLVNGGLVTSSDGYIGLNGGSEGSATVSSGTWSNSSQLSVGVSGTGSLLVNGGLVTDSVGYIGFDGGSVGTATVSSGTWSNSDDLFVGLSGTGSLLVNGGLVTDSFGYIGYYAGSEGSATVSSGTWSNSSQLSVGVSGTGSLLVDGGLVKSNYGIIGNGTGSEGSATVSSGTWDNSGTLSVGLFGTGSLLVNGGLVKNNHGYIGYSAGSEGSATVSSGTWDNTNYLYVGYQGTGSLLVNGGLVTDSYGYIGFDGGSVGTATVSSGTWSNSDDLSVGVSGTGSLLVNGGLVTDSYGYIGFDGGSVGTATVSSGTWSNSDALYVGFLGTGTLTASGGLVSANTIKLGDSGLGVGSLILSGSGVVQANQISEGAGTGTILFNGGTLRAGATQADFLSGFEPGDVTIGAGGAFIDSNTFTIGIGTVLSGPGALTKIGAGTLNLTGSNSYSGGTIVKSGTLAVGGGGVISHSGTTMIVGDVSGDDGSLLINGGLVTNSIGYIGRQTGSEGSATVSSGTWSNSSSLSVGYSGTGSLLVDGGLVTNALGYIGHQPGSEGSATVSSGIWSNSSDLVVGEYGTGNLLVNGGLVTNSYGYIGDQSGSEGSATVSSGTWSNSGTLSVGSSGTGSLLVDGGMVTNSAGYIGHQPGSEGSATVSSGTWRNSSDLVVGYSGTGSLLVDGGLVTSVLGYIGHQPGSEGSATVSSGTWSTDFLFVGRSGTGSLLVNGGLVKSNYGIIGYYAGSEGSATVSSGTWSNSDYLIVGYSGTGNLLVNGGLVTSSYGYIGLNGGSEGSATVSSGTWRNSNDLSVGFSGTGSLLVNGGLVTDSYGYIGFGGGSVGTATVSSGTWSNSSQLSVGVSGTGSLNLTDTGVVSVGAGSGAATVARNAGSVGTLNFGTGATAGTLLTAAVNGGSGTAVVNFNHTGTLNFAPQLTGSLSINKLAGGTTILTGNNTYSGPTDIQAGTLRVNGWNSGSGAVTVQNGATLGGSGTIAGAVTVANGGILAPGNSPGTMSLGVLNLNPGSLLNFELGPLAGPNDYIDVAGNLVLDGTLNVTALSGFGAGTYHLFGYGTVTDNVLNFGIVPGTYEYAIFNDTLNKQINLGVTLATAQYWDGANLAPVGSVTGGSGTWNNALTNWTSSTGNANSSWVGTLPAIFTGTAGTVTVADAINVAEMRFLTDGYVLSGTGSLATSGPTLTVLTDPAVSTQIATVITGAGALTKIGAGTLTLTGSNSYTNGTIVKGGTLAVAASGVINHVAANIIVGDQSGDNGSLLVNGGLVTNFEGYIGKNGSVGSATVSSGTWSNSGNLSVGYYGTGSLLVNGGLVTSSTVYIGKNGSVGSATVSSGTWSNSGDLVVGAFGTGSLLVDGGLVTNSSGYIGDQPGSEGSATVSSGTWSNSAQLYVGAFGTGSLLVNGGLVTNTYADIGSNGGSVGSATVSSGTWSNSSQLYVGYSGTGSLLVDGGLVTNSFGYIGSNGGSVGSATVSSGTWSNSGDLFVGRAGTGSLNLTDTGVVSVGAASGAVTVASNAASVGTLNIGTGTTAGTLLAAEVNGGSGTAVVNFNHTGTLNFAPQLTGLLSVNKLAAGTTILTGSNTYSGPTDIQAGTLRVNGVNSGTGALTVQSGGTLSGTGTIAGAVTVQNGGILSPGNSPGTLNVASLTLNALAISDFELGTSSDLVVVDTDFNLDGILNVTDSGGFANTGYTLFTYGGALTNNYFELNLVPTGWNRANFVVDTSLSGTVRLLVDNTVTIQNWSGTNTSPNGTISGGDGTWDNVLTNWTNTNGSLNTEWQGVVGVFSGTAGTVNVTDVVDFQQLQFATDGYVVSGTGALNTTGMSSEVWTGSGVGAEISAAITGTGALVKTGLGTLELTGSNSHSGGTTLNTGTLLVGDDEALGAGALALGDGTTFGVVSGGFAALINDVTVNGNINLSLAGNGFLILEGTVDLGAATRTLTFTEDLGEICLMGDVIGAGGLNLVMSGSGISSLVTMCGPDSNTYTGLTTVGDGVELELDKDPGATAIAGDLTVDAGGIVTLFDTSEQIHPASTVTVNGTLGILALSGTTTQTIGNLQGTGSIINTVGPTILTVKEGNFSGSILDGGADPLALIKSGPGTLSLSNANAYRGGTAIDAGRLQTLDPSALGSGPVALNGGSLAPGGTLTIDSLTWSGGTLDMAVGTSGNSLLEVTNDLTNGGSGGQFVFSGTTGFAANTLFPLVTVGGMLNGFTLTDFNGNNLFGLAPEFSLSGTTLSVRFNGSSSGPLLQNVGGSWTPPTADFLVSGVVQTGGPADDNTINSLLFNPGSSLQIFNHLTVTSGDFTVGRGRATMRGGNVIVPGALNKLGGGLLNIFSNVLVNGPANVRAGSLLVNGIFTTRGGLTVFQNALLGGSGLINGDVFNRGTISPGNSPGTLTVNGNFTQFSSGTLLIEIASPSVFDRLVVSGHASLAGTLQTMNFGGNKLKYGQQFAFLQAGSISGDFDRILMPDPDKFRGRFLAEGGTGTLLVAPTSYTLVAETTNQHNVAKALDSFIPARGDDREVVSSALDFLSEDQYPVAFDQIAPTFYESLTDITIEQINTQNQMLVQRLGSLRLGARGFQAMGLESPLMNDKDGKSVLDAKDGKDILRPTADNKWGAFAMGNGIFAKASPANQLSDYHFEGGGFAAGLDYHWSENFATGVYVGYQGAYAKYDNGSTASINGVNFGGYATYENDGFYADAIVGGGYNGYDVRRSIEFGDVNRTARSNPGGANLTTYLNTGYDWQAGQFTFGPILGGQYTYAGIGSFTERNADSLNLKVGQQNANSIRTTLGGHVAYTWKLTEHITIIPEVRMFWQHEFLENPRNIGASLDSGSGPGFGYETSAPDRDAVFAGAGVSAQLGKDWNAFFFYNADFGRQDYLGHAVSTGLGWKF